VSRRPVNVICCNGASVRSQKRRVIKLDYRPEYKERNVHVGLPSFVQDVYHLPPRILDLLELAAYVFATDRLVTRGRKDQLEYHGWPRAFDFHMKVRDTSFWNQRVVIDSLAEALVFATGDDSWKFTFYPGHSTPPTSLFDQAGVRVNPGDLPLTVTLFSGGLDSLAGCLEVLDKTTNKVLLVSHQSQPGTTHTQRQLAEALNKYYPGRVHHYQYSCHLKGLRAQEETQRTRAFLYSAIAFAIASAYGEQQIVVFENGLTGINLYRREDLANARASRTTHPKSMRLLQEFFSMVAEREFKLNLPFLFCTKRDVVAKLVSGSHPELISSTVSCTMTFKNLASATHCGECFQCVDRRLASFAAGADQYDHSGLYAADIITTGITDSESKTTVVDYIRQAVKFSESNLDHFQAEYMSELADIVDSLPISGSDDDKVTELWKLARRHGEAVESALKQIRDRHDNPFRGIARNSLLDLVSEREYLKPETKRLVESLIRVVDPAVHEMFRKQKPKDEPDLNEKVAALLKTHQPKLRSEHPTKSFACARVIPDHELGNFNVLIETKYVRSNTSPSKATDGIAADLTKYPNDAYILFLVYDPTGAIPNDRLFQEDIESRGRCSVKILR